MTFRPRNAYHLRISSNLVIPLFLYLDDHHVGWMSDAVLQYVLADLRPLIIPKLQAEKNVYFGPGTAPSNKRGTVEVHRGETYQFAYFFRKTDPHTVLLKSRHFSTASHLPEVTAKPTAPRPACQVTKKKRSRTQRKNVKTKGRREFSLRRVDEDESSTYESEQDTDGTDQISREPRPLRKQRRVITRAYEEDDNYVEVDVAMSSPPAETDGGSSVDGDVSAIKDQGAGARDSNDHPSLLSDAADIELVDDEVENKPKPLLRLKYQSFPISGHCLCVVVEPWPPLRAEPTLRSVGSSVQQGTVEAGLPVLTDQRARTPLFLPEYDRAPSEMPFAGEGTFRPVHPVSRIEGSGDGNNELMNFSQTLNAGGDMHALTFDDDDDMDGAILFGDADEVRELL